MRSLKDIINIIKQNVLVIIGGSALLTFLIVKVVDFLWNMSLEQTMDDSFVTYVASIGGYSPAIFIIIAALLTKICAARQTEKEKPSYRGSYTWKDIFKDRSFFALFLIMSFLMFVVIQIVIMLLVANSDNYAIISIADIPGVIFFLVAMVFGMQIALGIQNVMLPWFMQTEKGNKIASVIVLVLGVFTTIKMSGIEALWSESGESLEEFMFEYALGDLIPIDIVVLLFALLTVYLWYKVRKTPCREEKHIKTGFWLAVVSFVISLTPLATGIQFVWIYIRMMVESIGKHM